MEHYKNLSPSEVEEIRKARLNKAKEEVRRAEEELVAAPEKHKELWQTRLEEKQKEVDRLEADQEKSEEIAV